MVKNLQIRLSLEEEARNGSLKQRAAKYLGLSEQEFVLKILRKSIDARKPAVVFNYKLAAYIGEDIPENSYIFDYKNVSKARPVHIIGFGPAGMWAALRCLELGFKPVVLERGKNVQDRRRDLKAINQDHLVDEDSNYSRAPTPTENCIPVALNAAMYGVFSRVWCTTAQRNRSW